MESKKLQKAIRITNSRNTSSSSSYSSSSFSASNAAASGSAAASANEAVQISPQRVSLKLRISKYFVITVFMYSCTIRFLYNFSINF